MKADFFDSVRSSLYSDSLTQNQVEALDAIGQAWEQYGDGDNRKLAYILATAHHETGAFKWLKEIWGPTAAQKRYEGRADLGNTVAGDGKKYAGRGFVQLTGRRNYADWSRRTGLDLLKEPQLVEAYPVAARILVQGSMLGTFTGKKLGDYTSFKDMRRVINGTDKADLISGYAEKFLTALGKQAKPSTGHLGPKPIPVEPFEEDISPPVAPAKSFPWWIVLVAAAGLIVFVLTQVRF